MRKVLAPSIITLAISFSGSANAELASALANICEIVKTDDKGELRKKMKNIRGSFNLQLKDYYSGVTCGGKSLIKLAIESNATEAGTLLVKKMPKKLLAQPEHDGEVLLTWITAQGLADNPVSVALQERL
ncbi:DUF3718 domain-containing protein [Agaribacter flavus]|uniref:DUF3718 domain-containing protein n=1 Tax=Agaribacter flavus TaxID=1902781 RepID=A0ABV7FJY4_9ALTE